VNRSIALQIAATKFSCSGRGNIIGGGEPDDLDLFGGCESFAVDTWDWMNQSLLLSAQLIPWRINHEYPPLNFREILVPSN
jgi:hypothetical protein